MTLIVEIERDTLVALRDRCYGLFDGIAPELNEAIEQALENGEDE